MPGARPNERNPNHGTVITVISVFRVDRVALCPAIRFKTQVLMQARTPATVLCAATLKNCKKSKRSLNPSSP
jgi:hypothetical protein